MYTETSKLEKVLGAKLLPQNVLKRYISTESIALGRLPSRSIALIQQHNVQNRRFKRLKHIFRCVLEHINGNKFPGAKFSFKMF